MAEQDFTTKNKERGGLWWTTPQAQELISILRAVRATGDLLNLAGDTVKQGRQAMCDNTLIDLGDHLEDLATEGLVILGYEGPKEEPQAEPEGGAA